MKYILSILCIFFAGTLLAQEPAFIRDSLDTYIQREMKRWDIPGVAIAVVHKGDIITTKGYGFIDAEQTKPVDDQTLFMIASNSKLFTGTSLALLAYEGQLALTDKITDHLDYFKMYNDTLTAMVTLEDILSHRLGFETFQGDFYNWNNNASRKEIIENIAKNKPVYGFRTQWGYCNAGFVTAGEVVHAVTDTTWEEFIAQRFFQPLHMNRTNASYAGIARDKNAAKPYTIFDGKLIKLEYDNLDNIAPCGGINSCSADLANWVLTQLQNGVFEDKQIIPGDVINETRIPRSIVGDGHSGLFPSQHYDLYGLGIEMNDFGGEEMVWHTGGADGFVTTVCMVPGKDLGIVILTNTDANYFFIAALYQMLEAYFDMPYRNLSALFYGFYKGKETQDMNAVHEMYKKAEKKEALPLPGSLMTGAFYNPVYGKMFVTLDGADLVLKFEHHPQLKGKLQYMGDNTFVCTYDPISYGVKEISFTIDDNKVSSFTISINEFIDLMPYVFTRL